MFDQLAAEGVAVHAERVGGAVERAIVAREHLRDEAAFELAMRLGIAQPLVHHLFDQAIELVAQRHQSSSRPVRRRNASRYFSRVRATTSSGSEGTGGCLFQWIDSR